MSKCMCYNTLFAVISGSFRKHLAEIGELKRQLESQGVAILSPQSTEAVNPNDEFIVLDSDPIEDHRVLQDSVFAKIRRSTFLVVANVDGYIGRAAVLEMGYAIAMGIAIYTLMPVDDPNLAPYCRLVGDIFPKIDPSRSLYKTDSALANAQITVPVPFVEKVASEIRDRYAKSRT